MFRFLKSFARLTIFSKQHATTRIFCVFFSNHGDRRIRHGGTKKVVIVVKRQHYFQFQIILVDSDVSLSLGGFPKRNRTMNTVGVIKAPHNGVRLFTSTTMLMWYSSSPTLNPTNQPLEGNSIPAWIYSKRFVGITNAR